MKKQSLNISILAFCFLVPSTIGAQVLDQNDHQYKSKNCNLTDFNKIPEIQAISDKIHYAGSIELKQNVNVTEKDIIRFLKVDSLSTFSLDRETKSRFDENVSYKRFQQYYKGIRVDGGGYSVKFLINPSKSTPKLQLFSPHIYYNLPLNVTPSIPVEALANILGVEAVESRNFLFQLYTVKSINCFGKFT